MEKLFCDCKTDAEKSAFFLSGRAVETGVIAAAISNDVAMAYHRCDEFKKERDDAKAAAENIALKLDYLRSKFETAKNAQNDWLRANAPGGWIDNLRIENEALRAKVEQMERQELGYRERCTPSSQAGGSNRFPLYALPGSKGEEK